MAAQQETLGRIKPEGTKPVEVVLFQRHTLLEFFRNFLAPPKDQEKQEFVHSAPIHSWSAKSVSDSRNLAQQIGGRQWKRLGFDATAQDRGSCGTR